MYVNIYVSAQSLNLTFSTFFAGFYENFWICLIFCSNLVPIFFESMLLLFLPTLAFSQILSRNFERDFEEFSPRFNASCDAPEASKETF